MVNLLNFRCPKKYKKGNGYEEDAEIEHDEIAGGRSDCSLVESILRQFSSIIWRGK